MLYPKIETLYNRDPKTFKVITDQVRCPEFECIKTWSVTEKIDGTNIRIMWNATEKKVTFGGRTDNAQIPATLVAHLVETFTPDKFNNAFDVVDEVILFGEGYGPKIQKGGGNYCQAVSFRLFDVLVGRWWLDGRDVIDIASSMGTKSVPYLAPITELPRSIYALSDILPESHVAYVENNVSVQAEGIVARSTPLMFDRAGNRVMWKLKFKDF
jgi:hypothetical protein